MNLFNKASVTKWIIISIIFAVLSSMSRTYGGENPLCHLKYLRVGIATGNFPPFIFSREIKDTTRTIGLDIDIVKTLVKSCPLESRPIVVWKEAPFNELFERLKDGQFDLVISSISINVPDPERNGLAYSHPYYDKSGLVLAVKKGSKAQKDLIENGIEALSRHLVYVQKGTSAYDFIKELCGEDHVRTPKDPEADLNAVFKFAADSAGELIIYDWAHLYYILDVQQVYQDWEIFKSNGNPNFLTHEQYGIVVSEKETALLLAINEKIDQNKEEIDNLIESWFRRIRHDDLMLKIEEGGVTYEAPPFLLHPGDALSKSTLKLGGGISYKDVTTGAISGSLEFPIGVYKIWASPEIREFFFGFYRDFELTFLDPSASLTYTSSKGSQSEIISKLWSINPITTKYTFCFSSAKISVNLIFLGYTSLRKEERTLNGTGRSQNKITQTDRITYTVQEEFKMPLANIVDLDFSLQRIFPWTNATLTHIFPKSLETSFNVGLSITPFAKK